MAQGNSQNSEQSSSIRETIESVWIAVVLAFILRAFVLEAFVIPTGSMAPRLMGQHWQFDCRACGYHYAFGLPHDPKTPPANLSVPLSLGGRLGAPLCPNCGYRNMFKKE
ncbi:MAG: S26 family signal peptidase, partial [Phycisphaerae bacterium]|nr:S26 family signal peptidase [Phycisphaerae bacterium]